MKKVVMSLATAMMLTVGASTIFPPVDTQAATIIPPSHATIAPAASDPYDPIP